MLNKLFLTSLITACTSTVATQAPTNTTPVAPTPAPRPIEACVAGELGKTILFEIDDRSDVPAHNPVRTTRIYTNGAWSYEGADAGQPIARETGCLSAGEIADLTTKLDAASWATELQQLRCMAYSANYASYLYRGKSVLTLRMMCDGKVIDQSAATAIRVSRAFVDNHLAANKPQYDFHGG